MFSCFVEIVISFSYKQCLPITHSTGSVYGIVVAVGQSKGKSSMRAYTWLVYMFTGDSVDKLCIIEKQLNY